ncbi:MAG: conserved repeat domain protein [Thermoleophilia bacterium]|nr:conserved repeat domain protein [Thermoleophilia bacterium]
MLLPRTMFVAPTTRLRLVLLSLVVLLAALMVQAASAPSARAAQLDTTPIAGTTFEGGDGNVTRNEIGQIDWENLVPFTVTQDAASTSNSAVWGGGVKQEEPQTWFWQTGEVNDKTNILSAASVAKNLGDVFLYFGFQTEAASGNANFAIELNQLQPTYTSTEANTTPTTKRTTDLPRRKAGDLLISYDVTNSDVKIGACKWKGTAAIGEWVHADDATSIDSNEKTCHPLDSTKAEGAVNDTALAMPTGMGGTFAFPIPKDGFGEASINISKALGLGGTSTCFSFGSIWMHSRTSLELSSQPKDLMAPMELSLGSCSIDILKKQQVNTTAVDGYTTGSVDAYIGDTINYRLEVRNAGTQPITSVVPTDNDCGSISAPTKTGGNTDSILEVGELWVYTCSHPVAAGDVTAGTYRNTASVKGVVNSLELNDSSFVTAAVKSAGLTITKLQTTTPADATTYAPGPVTLYAGGTISYRLVITNTGTTTLSNIDVTDAGCTGLVDPAGTLAPGASVTVTCSKATANALTPTSYVNVASVTATDGTKSPTATSNSVTATTIKNGLVLDKKQATAANTAFIDATNAELTVRAGSTLHYLIEVTNTGNATVSNVTLADANCTATTPVASLAPNATTTFRCTQATTGSATRTNSAQATATDALGGTVTSNTDLVTARTVTTGLELEKVQSTTAPTTFADGTDQQVTVYAGATLYYVVRVKNTGNYPLTNVTLSDPGCSATTPLGSLDPGAYGSFLCSKVTDASAATYTNTATATGTDVLNAPVNSNGDFVVARTVTTGLVLDKKQATAANTAFADATNLQLTVPSGTTLHYVIEVHNTGNHALTNVTLTDANCTATTAIAQLDAGAYAYFRCTQSTNDTLATHDNSARATGTDVLSGPVVSNLDTVSARTLTSGLLLEKRQAKTAGAFASATHAEITVRSGDTIHYVIRVKNTGNYALTDVTLTDPNCSTTTPLASLAAGAEYDFTCSKTTSGAGTTWDNDAQATGTSLLGLPVTSLKDSVSARVVTTGLTLTKRQATTAGAFADATHGEITVRSGDTIHYVIRVKNIGNYALTNVTLTDPNCTTTTALASLATGAEFDFTCSKTTSGAGTTWKNEAQATGTDVLSQPVTSPKDDVTARVVTTGLTLEKRQSATAGTFEQASDAPLRSAAATRSTT